MKEFKVTLFKIINKIPVCYTTIISCEDPATEIWLNPMFKNVLEVQQIG